MAAWGVGVGVGDDRTLFFFFMPCTHASQNLASQDSQDVCNSRCLRLCSHLLCAENAASVHGYIMWLFEVIWTNFLKKKKSDFQFWFEEIEKKLHPARMVASLPAGTEPNFSSDMTVQPPVRRDLLLSSYQWGRGMPHTQIKTWKCFKGKAGPKVMQPTACHAAFELQRAEHTQTMK